jgi:hypothetical protein
MQQAVNFSPWIACLTIFWKVWAEITDHQMQILKSKIVRMVLMAKSQPNGVFD